MKAPTLHNYSYPGNLFLAMLPCLTYISETSPSSRQVKKWVRYVLFKCTAK